MRQQPIPVLYESNELEYELETQPATDGRRPPRRPMTARRFAGEGETRGNIGREIERMLRDARERLER